MTIKPTRKSDLHWKSYDSDNNEWFTAQISLYDFSAVKTSDEEKAKYLKKLLKGAVRLNSEFLSKWNGFDVKTTLEFNKDWGLGSSSTLTALVAQWADVNPLLLHFKISEGSGCDVACAGADLPIQYQVVDDTINYTEIDFDPPFKKNLFFVYLNNKQSSPKAVEYYHKNVSKRATLVKKQTQITESMISCTSFSSFKNLVLKHEALVAEHLKLKPIQQEKFSDFDGAIKSLGAWGGDFILACSDAGQKSVTDYFKAKGLETVIPYEEMILVPTEA